jgi:HK97 family phage portal protein
MALFGRRKTEDRALQRGTIPSVFLPDPATGTVGPHAATRIADVYACVRVLADSAASLPLIAYRRTAQGRVRAGGRAQELIDRPAPATTTAGFLGQLMAHLNLWGNAFIGKFRDRDGRVAQLGLLDPDAVTVEIENGEPRYTLYRQDGVSNHGTDDILHVRAALSQDGVLGLSPIRQAGAVLTLSRELTQHATDTMRRGARLSGVLTTPADVTIDPDNLEAIRTEISTSWTGVENSGAIALVTGGLQFQPLSMPLQDAQFIEQRNLSTQEIARIFRVMPWMIGAPSGDSMTYSNTTEQARAFAMFSLKPWLAVIEQALTADRDLMPTTVYAEFLLDDLLRADSKTRAEVYSLALDPQKGWLTRNEVRKLENLPQEPEEE